MDAIAWSRLAVGFLALLALAGLSRASHHRDLATSPSRWFAAACAGSVLFLAMAVGVVTESGVAAYDDEAAAWADAVVPDAVARFFLGVGVAGGLLVVGPLIALGTGLFWWRGQRRQALRLLLPSAVGVLLVGLLKVTFARERPQEAVAEMTTLSFPSGHATNAAVVAAWLVHIGSGLAKRRVLATSAMVAAGVWLVLISVSRLGLRVHFLSDVLGGAGLGLAISGFVFAAAWPKALSDRLPTPRDRAAEAGDSADAAAD